MSTPEDQISGENKTIVFTSQANTSIQYAIGDIVGESYVLLSLLASGGMGVLFKARHLQLDRIYALKLLPTFSRKACRWNSSCSHSKDVCAALRLTHSKGIVHRDIKPSNLFMVQSSSGSGAKTRRTKAVDFGIARLTGSEGQNLQGLTPPGEVFASPAYMSPEQTEGKAVTGATDIYSLGCTTHAALTGHAPFKSSTAIETMMDHQVDQAPEIKRPDFSPGQNNDGAIYSGLLCKTVSLMPNTPRVSIS